MFNFSANLMLINKMIIFLDYYIEDSIDLNFFNLKMNQDIQYIQAKLMELFEVYLKENSRYQVEHFEKQYLSTLERYKKTIKRITGHIHDQNSIQNLELICSEINKKIETVKNYNYRHHIFNNEKQYINENEYAILLKNLEE